MQKITLNQLNFEITIHAPVAKVWDTMLGQETYPVWCSEFNMTPETVTWYEGNWQEGSKIKFLGEDKSNPEQGICGMTSEIAENRLHEFISIRHLGYIMNGQEITDTPEIQAIMPSYENYSFQKIDETTTTVQVYMQSDPNYTEMFAKMWPKALEKLKEICEKGI